MSESKIPPQGLVPHASSIGLAEEVIRLNVPFLDENDTEHPGSKLLALFEDEHPAILQWGSDVGGNINLGFGGSSVYQTNEKMAFDNSFVTAYGLIRVGYEEAGREMPGAYQPPEWYMWMRDEPEQTIPEMFETLNQRQRALFDEYPALLLAMQAWATERIPYHGRGGTVGAVAIAAAEVYYAFVRTEEITSLERLVEPDVGNEGSTPTA